MNSFKEFKSLHTNNVPFHVGNVWDVNSAKIFAKNGYKALATSSDAITASLGYEDGKEMSFEELFHVVKAIKAKTTLPLSVDLESGYSRDKNKICENIIKLIEIGVVGINLEDSIVINGSRQIVDADEFSQTIEFIKDFLAKKEVEIFLNIRTDFYLMGLENALKETMQRSRLYEKAGADGLFVPCITDENDIRDIIENTSLPVNVMTMPNLPNFSTLQHLGVTRISSGPFLYNTVNTFFNDTLKSINDKQSFSPLFE